MRVRKIIGWSAFALVAVIAVLLVILLLVDVTVYRGPLQAGVSELLGRPVKLEGEMSLTPSLWPTIVVEEVHIANPEWASRPNFASAERLEFQVALLPLILGDLRILSLALDGVDILLEGRPDGTNNWTFKEKKPAETGKLPDIQAMTGRQSVIGYRLSADRVYRFAVTDVGVVLAKGEQIQIQGSGKYRDLPFTLVLLGGTPAEFMAAKPWPVQVMARVAGTTVNAEGTVSRPLEGEGFDLRVAVEGTQLGELGPLFDIALPALGPFEFSGRIAETAERYAVTELTGRLGDDALTPLTITKGTVLVPYAKPVELDIEGKYGDAPFNVAFAGGSLNELTDGRRPWPVKVEAHATGAILTIAGKVATQTGAQGFDATIRLNGREFSELSPLLGANLPELGPYELSAQAVVRDKDLTVTALKGHLGGANMPTRLAVTKGTIVVADGQPISLDVEGSYGDIPYMGALVGSTLRELIAPTQPWPVRLTVRAAGATLRGEGSVAKSFTDGFDLGLNIRGKRFSKLEPLAGVALPALGSYELAGRVRGQAAGYTITDLAGRIGGTGAPMRVAIAKGKLTLPQSESIHLDVGGAYNDTRFTVSLIGGSLTELTQPSKPWPITLTARGVGATLNANGTVAEPKKAKGFNLQAKMKGKRFDALAPLFRVALPRLGGYEFSARIVDSDGRYTITGLKGGIGKTDITGVLDVVTTGPRPRITAMLTSTTTDIASLINTDKQTGANGSSSSPLNLTIPRDTLRAFDADLNIKIKRVTGGPITVRDLAVSAKLDNGRATLAPIQVSLPGLQIKGRLELNARGKTPSVKLDASTDRVDVAKALTMFSDIDRLRGAVANTNISFTGKGKTVEALLQQSTLQLTLRSADIDYLAKENGEIIPIKISNGEIKADRGQALEMTIEGTIRDVPVSSRFTTASLADLVADPKVWPVTLSVSAPDAALGTKGTLSWPLDGKDFDLEFSLNGNDLSGLDSLLEAELPALGPYAVSGRFVNADDKYRLSKLEIKVDRNHTTGNLEIVTSGPRPKFIASLRTDEFHIEDFVRELQKRKDQAPAKPDDGRVIPDVTIPVKALRSVDLELNINVTVMLARRADLGDVSVKAKLENGHLLISPFKGALSGGQLSVKLDVDATGNTPVMSFQLTGEHVDYGTLLKTFEVTDAIESVLEADINLTGRGDTLRSVLADANGSVLLISGPGSIGAEGLDIWGADLLTGIMTVSHAATKQKKVTELNCMVWPFGVTNGVARSETILIDMPKVTVGGTGTINFGTEALDLRLKPARKKASLLKLGPPVRVTGTASEPDIKVEGKAKTFGKALLPFFNPAFLLVTAEGGTGDMNPCVAAITGIDGPGEAVESKRGIFSKLLDKFEPTDKPVDAESGEAR